MKAAIIGDIHANLHALQAVLADIGRRRIRTIWNVGDCVGYAAGPDEVVRLLAGRKIPTVLGNYDQKVLQAPQKAQEWRARKDPQKVLSFTWTYEHLSAQSRRYLAVLPEQLRFRLGPYRVLLTHGSPAAIDEYILPDTPEARLAELAELADADIIAVGHTHVPLVRRVGEAWFVNTGSVGRNEVASPDGRPPGACYAILDVTGSKVRVEHVEVEYDAQAAAGDIRKAGLPEEFAQMVLTGRKLDEVKAGDAKEAATDTRGQDARVTRRRDACDTRGQDARDTYGRDAHATDARATAAHATSLIDAATALAESLHYDPSHARQVTHLALMLFDELAGARLLEGLGQAERMLLHCAGILHDIGWIGGRKGHHKRSMEMILADRTLELDARQRLVVANVARYHRKAVPSAGHEQFDALTKKEKAVVRMLAGVLRVADGLDCTHGRLIRQVKVRLDGDRLVIECRAVGDVAEEFADAALKADLLARQLRREVVFERQ